MLEEYKLLTQQYIHEDQVFFTPVQIYVAINAGTLAILAGKDIAKSRAIVSGLCIFAILLSMLWSIVLLRIRAWRNALENRISEIEALAEKHLRYRELEQPYRPRMRPAGPSLPGSALNSLGRSSRIIYSLSASALLALFPIIVGIVWMGILFATVFP